MVFLQICKWELSILHMQKRSWSWQTAWHKSTQQGVPKRTISEFLLSDWQEIITVHSEVFPYWELPYRMCLKNRNWNKTDASGNGKNYSVGQKNFPSSLGVRCLFDIFEGNFFCTTLCDRTFNKIKLKSMRFILNCTEKWLQNKGFKFVYFFKK